MNDEPKNLRLPLMISQGELAAIDEYRFSRRIPTRAQAVRHLLQVGLRVAEMAEEEVQSETAGEEAQPEAVRFALLGSGTADFMRGLDEAGVAYSVLQPSPGLPQASGTMILIGVAFINAAAGVLIAWIKAKERRGVKFAMKDNAFSGEINGYSDPAAIAKQIQTALLVTAFDPNPRPDAAPPPVAKLPLPAPKLPAPRSGTDRAGRQKKTKS
ncbi:hypothetical protein ACLF3G_03160 [Falsiroseomonas sp. HC035]|uniref:hypothetical protein n=1 Tax=Falsiroseomonas sp. HC035 TaxID=3390999 RepID=UPI003D318F95